MRLKKSVNRIRIGRCSDLNHLQFHNTESSGYQIFVKNLILHCSLTINFAPELSFSVGLMFIVSDCSLKIYWLDYLTIVKTVL